MRLKAKLVLAITTMVAALVIVFAYVYVSQVVRVRVTETYNDGDLFAHQIYNAARQAMEVDLSNTPIDTADAEQTRAAIREVLETDPGLNSLLQSTIGYSLVVYDAALVDTNGFALLHTNPELQGHTIPERPSFARVRQGGLWHQLHIVYYDPPWRVYEVTLPLERGGAPFGTIRVGISTALMKNELRPQLHRALLFSAIAVLVCLLLAAALSNLALHPLEVISRRLDRMSAGDFEPAPEAAPRPADEYGVVSNKIDRLGRQFRDAKEVFSALKENLDQIMANLQDGLMLFTRDSRAVLVSASAEQFVGRPRREILGQHISRIFSPDSPLGSLVLNSFAHHQALDGYEVDTGSGRRVQAALDFIEERGERIGALLTLRDAESVRRIEDEIELSRRLAAVGRLTSGVAHEVKNPINAIVVHLEVLREKLRQLDPDTQRHMDIIGSEIQRLDRVVQTLVDFTRPVELRLADLDLRRLVEDVVVLASPEAERHGVHLERTPTPEPLPVKADADLIKQALLNVVLNGVQAMSGGGTLALTAQRDSGSVAVDIHDEGPGIPPEIRDKIFNLYFTTKQKGSGIGLAMTYRVMQLHNGSIDFQSEPGHGTTFHLRLPLFDSRQEAFEEATAKRV